MALPKQTSPKFTNMKKIIECREKADKFISVCVEDDHLDVFETIGAIQSVLLQYMDQLLGPEVTAEQMYLIADTFAIKAKSKIQIPKMKKPAPKKPTEKPGNND